ncbi:MAG: hypothetical protein OEY07_20340, partial [Gammaproteobacteria bacterium]|nr:hypothetical protein [Gammaproteobacteria bacterium]
SHRLGVGNLLIEFPIVFAQFADPQIVEPVPGSQSVSSIKTRHQPGFFIGVFGMALTASGWVTC